MLLKFFFSSDNERYCSYCFIIGLPILPKIKKKYLANSKFRIKEAGIAQYVFV